MIRVGPGTSGSEPFSSFDRRPDLDLSLLG
jgi:hypothetical protein